MEQAVELEQPDHVIHLGDHVRDAEELGQRYAQLPVLMVRGNCDYDFSCRESAVVDFNGVRIMAVHGHRYGVKSGLLRLALAAKENNVDVALFGHTHCAYCEDYDGIRLLNPGSCGYGGKPSYGIVEIENGRISCRLGRF